MATKSQPPRPTSTRAAPTQKRPAAAAKSARPAVKRPAKPVEAPVSKQAQLITLLRTGASIADLSAATGWQAHSVRSVISGVLRKKLGLKVVCTGEAGARQYRIVGSA